ncbi:MAG: hypothetical protein WA996_11005 [Candidatus Promineifilaceae bacterium]
MNTMDVRLQQAIAAARAGKRDESRVLVDRFLEDQPDNVHAIFLKSTLVTSKEDQVECLRQVLIIDPDHRGAKLMLDRLGEPIEAEPAAIIQPVVELEEQLEEEEVEPVVIAEDDLPAEDILATTVVLAAGEMEEEVIGESDWPVIEEGAEPELEETLIVIPDEPLAQESEDMPELIDDEDVPEWLTKEVDYADEATVVHEEFVEEEEMPLEMGELPDWLQEEPTEEWLSQEPLDTTESEVEYHEGFIEETVFISGDELVEEPTMTTATKPKRKGKKVSNRALEIVLGLLVFLAVVVMVGLVYVFFTSF